MIVAKVEKQPFELFPLGVEFAEEMLVGETIATATVVSRNAKTGVDTTGALLVGGPTPGGSDLNQLVHQGVAGEQHLVEYSITTSKGHRFQSEILVDVVTA